MIKTITLKDLKNATSFTYEEQLANFFRRPLPDIGLEGTKEAYSSISRVLYAIEREGWVG